MQTVERGNLTPLVTISCTICAQRMLVSRDLTKWFVVVYQRLCYVIFTLSFEFMYFCASNHLHFLINSEEMFESRASVMGLSCLSRPSVFHQIANRFNTIAKYWCKTKGLLTGTILPFINDIVRRFAE